MTLFLQADTEFHHSIRPMFPYSFFFIRILLGYEHWPHRHGSSEANGIGEREIDCVPISVNQKTESKEKEENVLRSPFFSKIDPSTLASMLEPWERENVSDALNGPSFFQDIPSASKWIYFSCSVECCITEHEKKSCSFRPSQEKKGTFFFLFYSRFLFLPLILVFTATWWNRSI